VSILAGADIKEMQNNTMSQMVSSSFLDQWATTSKIKKPIIAAVNGFALSFFLIGQIFFNFISYYYLLVRWWL
jgi:hypothetical protein